MTVLVLALLALAGLSVAAYAASRTAAPSNSLSFTWSMPDRFGGDADQDGLIDYKQSPEYLNPASWDVKVDACASAAVTSRGAGTKLTWTFTGTSLAKPITVTGGCALSQSLPKLGSYAVAAKLVADAGVTTSSTVLLKDTLIVSVGDSVASGEGNPDTLGAKNLGPFPYYTAKWQDEQCDRSALAGPAQAAVRLEKRDPHSSVTFLHLACSGADIENGLLGPYAGQHPEVDGTKLPPKPAQLDEALRLAGWVEKDGVVTKTGRKIDNLLVSIGANNMGFGDIVKSCLAVEHCQTTDDDPVLGKRGGKIFEEGIKKLPPLYKKLDARIDAMGANSELGNLFLTQYYDVSQFDDKSVCTGQTPQERAGNVNGPNSSIDGFKADEFAWTHEVVSPAINKEVAAAVTTGNSNGGPKWNLVDGIQQSFEGHGYCAKDRWIRQLFESLTYQHGIDGAFHPTTEGHLYGYAANIERVVADVNNFGGTPVAFVPDEKVNLTVDGVGKYLGLFDRADAFETVLRQIPFSGREFAQKGYQQIFAWIAKAQGEIKKLSTKAGMSLTQLENRLDDLDDDNDPTSDAHIPGLPELTIDLDVDITPKALAKSYDVTVKLAVKLDGTGRLKFLADGLSVGGERLTSDLGFTAATTLHIEPTAAKKVKIPAGGADLVRMAVGLNGTYDAGNGHNPLTLNLGLLDASAEGRVSADIGVALKLEDKDGSGFIDATQLDHPGDLLSTRCVSKGASVDLTVKAGFAGLDAKAGRITLADSNLCNGIDTPDVELGDLGQFRNVSLADLVNGLAQVTQAIQSAQAAGDLDLPFVSEPLSSVVSVNRKLVDFFVRNGFTDPKNPLASITVDTSDDAPIRTLQALTGKLAEALGLPAEALNVRWADGRVLFTLRQSTDPPAKPNAGTLDFGDTFKNNGITSVTGSAKATIDPTYDLDLGFGFDLRPNLSLQDRFFLTNGTKGYAFALDADVTADVDLTGTASVASVRLTDGNATGPVTLLKRKEAGKPMVAVTLVEPDAAHGDGRVTLAELATAVGQQALPISASLNATVPPTDLAVSADVVGLPVAAGRLTIAWPNVPDITGAGRLTVTGDASFTGTLLPLAFDTSNPKALVGQVLTAAREAITRLRGTVAGGASTAQTPLPLIGKSIADLDPVLAKVQTALDPIIASNELLTLKSVRGKINELLARAIGVTGTTLPDLVTLAYEPRTASKPAAVVVGLKLGACTTDRHTAADDGCTVTRDPVASPFNLQLGPDSKVGGVAGLGSTGAVNISYDARAQLAFGVTLPDVAAGASPGDAPVVTGKPALFVQDNSGFTAGVGVKFSGSLHAGLGPLQIDLGSAANPARASLAARFALAAANPTGKRYVVGSAELTSFLEGLVPKAGSANVHETEGVLKATCPGVNGTVDACVTLPVYSDSTSLGTITFNAPDLLSPAGWKFDSSAVEAALGNESIQFSLIVNGVRTLAAQLERGLRNLPADTRLPLLGTNVTTAADVVKTFDDKVLGKIQTLSETLAKAPDTGAVRTRTEELLNSISIVKAGGGAKTTLVCRTTDSTAPCTGTEPITKLQSFEVALPLTFEVTRSLGAFDVGFPGLRLSGSQGVTGSAGLDITLAFGVDRNLGFFVPTQGSDPELALRVSGRLPATMSGQLAFLPIQIKDLTPGVDDVTVSAGVDITSRRADGRLTLQDLGAAEFTPSLSAKAAVHLGVTTVRPEAASTLPVLRSDVLVDATVSWSGRAGTEPVTTASINFDKVTLDGGSFVSDFLKPVARELRKFTQPLEKPIDEIRKPIPGLSDAAKRAGKAGLTWYSAFKEIDKLITPPGEASGLQLIDRVISFVDLVRAIDDDSGAAGEIPVGSFSLDTAAAANPVPLDDASSLINGSSLLTPDVLDKIKLTDNAGNGAADTAALRAASKTGGFTFPAFEKPTQLFSMLLGEDVPLVYFDAGKLSIERSFQLAYPIGPAKLYIGGMAGLSGHFAVGFDTYGVRKAFEVLTDNDTSNNGVWDVTKGLLQGLYVDDRDRSGKDVPEISLQAELTAGASVGVPGFEAGAEGGIHGQIDFDLHTEPSQHGKIRYPDIAAQTKINPNPVCFFDASAQVDAFIRLYVNTPLGRGEYPIASGTVWKQDDLLTFCRTKADDTVHRLADLSGDGTLTLQTGEGSQSIFLTQTAPGVFQVSADGVVESYSGVKKIFADLKAGDDELDIEQGAGVDTSIPVVLCGGPGNDRIGTQVGPATLSGDGGSGCTPVTTSAAGDDTLTAAGAGDTLDGGPGNDALDGGAGNDTLTGDAGNDVLRGGLGDDTIDGGADDDTTDYSDHTTAVSIAFPGPSGAAGEKDTAAGVENVYGSTGRDTITLPTTGSYRVDAGAGDDSVTGAGATSLVVGGDGADRVVGGTGGATILGGGGDDTLVDGPGSQTYLGQEGTDTVDYSGASARVEVTLDGLPDDGAEGSDPDNITDADIVIGSRFADRLTGSGAAEELRGGAGGDTLTGGPGADVLLGGDDADELDGNSGGDRLDGGNGADTLVGGTGADDFVGGAGGDTADYSVRTESLDIVKNDVDDDGSALDSYRDNVHTDVEKVIGGSGDDDIEGYSGHDELLGGPGADELEGRQGEDTIIGGSGDDRMYDKTVNMRYDTDESAADTFDGGEGNDHAYGNGGTDTYLMGAGQDMVDAGPGKDTIRGGADSDTLYAGDGDDVVDGDDGDDNIHGEDGNDVIRQNGSDLGRCSIWGGNGNDTLYNGTHGGSIYAGVSGGSTETDTGPNTIYGYDGEQNVYTGGNGPDRMILGAGNDIVYGSGGNDVITTGEGSNTVRGEGGDDTVTGGSASDTLFGGADNDTLNGGGDRDNVQGEGGNDVLNGDAGDDDVRGGPGDDILTGGANADELAGGDGVDTVTYADRSEAVEFVEDGNHNDGSAVDLSNRPGFEGYRDYIDYEVERVVGGSGNDTLRIGDAGRKGAAVLEGGPGDDTLSVRTATPTTLIGGSGDDTLTGGGGNDIFGQGTAIDGADDMTGGDGVDTVDYTARPAGSAFVTLDGAANDGASGEGDNVHSDVENAPGAAGGTATNPTVSVAPVAVTEGRAGTTTAATFRVSLSGPSGRTVTVPWSITSGTATAGRDFTAATGTVRVPVGATSESFTVRVLGDALDESNETAVVTLGTPTGATLRTARTQLTVIDDDATPTVSVTGTSVAEGKQRTTARLVFTVKLSAVSGRTATVRIATVNGTARSGSDYTAKAETMTFTPGQTVKTFVVSVRGDVTKEANETLQAVLSKPVNTTIKVGRATGTIRNDDRGAKKR